MFHVKHCASCLYSLPHPSLTFRSAPTRPASAKHSFRENAKKSVRKRCKSSRRTTGGRVQWGGRGERGAVRRGGGAFCENAINNRFFKVRLELIINCCNKVLLERRINRKNKRGAYTGTQSRLSSGEPSILSNKERAGWN